MTVVKMPPVNVGLCVTAFMQVSADGCREMGLGPSLTAREVGEINNVTLWTFYFYETISRDFSRDLF